MKGDNIMLNKEKYAKEILDIVCQDGVNPAVIDNIPVNCLNTECHNCQFYGIYCVGAFVKWANSEYKEREIDWSKVPVDTPIVVGHGNNKYNRHFACFKDNKIHTWAYGKTSHTAYNDYKNCEPDNI